MLIMFICLCEIVEKVVSVLCLNEVLNILVIDICFVMDIEVCLVYLVDYDWCCYYLMVIWGLKKLCGCIVMFVFDEGIVGLVGRLVEPINFVDV